MANANAPDVANQLASRFTFLCRHFSVMQCCAEYLNVGRCTDASLLYPELFWILVFRYGRRCGDVTVSGCLCSRLAKSEKWDVVDDIVLVLDMLVDSNNNLPGKKMLQRGDASGENTIFSCSGHIWDFELFYFQPCLILDQISVLDINANWCVYSVFLV